MCAQGLPRGDVRLVVQGEMRHEPVPLSSHAQILDVTDATVPRCEHGWTAGAIGQSCTDACAKLSLKCDPNDLYMHNSEVDTHSLNHTALATLSHKSIRPLSHIVSRMTAFASTISQ